MSTSIPPGGRPVADRTWPLFVELARPIYGGCAHAPTKVASLAALAERLLAVDEYAARELARERARGNTDNKKAKK